MDHLTDMQRAVMSGVERLCGFYSGSCTADIAMLVARQPGRDSNRKHSALVSLTLHELEVLGHVRRLDDMTPIVWCRSSSQTL